MGNILITGCSSGFGLLSAAHFARKGDRVFATLRDLARGLELERIRQAEDLAIEILQLDVLDSSSVEAAVKRAEADGPIDALINNAGIEVRGSIEDISEQEARLQFDTNVHGALRMIRAVLPGMRQRGSGTIVNISSIGGLVGRPFGGLYAATKHALEAISEALYFEVQPFGVRVAVVEPGRAACDPVGRARQDSDATTTIGGAVGDRASATRGDTVAPVGSAAVLDDAIVTDLQTGPNVAVRPQVLESTLPGVGGVHTILTPGADATVAHG